MAHFPIDSERIEAARRLYLKYEGKQHEKIERDMRALGYTNFNRRILYPRFERQKYRPGWIEKYFLSEPPAVAGGSTESSIEIHTDEPARPAARDNDQHAKAHLQPPATAGGSDFDYFQAWLKDVSPGMTWTWKHQVHIYKRLKRVTDGECKRLMIFLPPRHGKSELVTVRYTAWRMKQDPKMNVILGSYNQRLANRFSRKIRNVLMDDYALGRKGEEEKGSGGDGHTAICRHGVRTASDSDRGPTEARKRTGDCEGCRLCKDSELGTRNSELVTGPMFPFIRNRPKNTESEWETAVGGGLRAVGVGAGVTGFGADLIVIDDPVKSRAEAESQKMRERVWHWFNDDIYTRLESNGSIVLIQTRWHEDDLAGRLLREEGSDEWEVVNLPALSEPPASAGGIRVSQEKGDFAASRPPSISGQEGRLAPALTLSADSVISPSTPPANSVGSDTRDEIGRLPGVALCPERYNEAYFKQLQQKLGSYSFAALYQQRPVPAEGGMFKRKWFENNIIAAAPPNLRWKRGTDPGVSAGEKADYSASVRVAIDRDGNMYIADMFRRQVEYPDLKRFIIERLQQEHGTEHAIELACHGNAIHQDVLKDHSVLGRAFRGVKTTDPKLARALGWLALAEAGKVYLVRGAWNDEFLNEIASFPMGTHDDQIDAVSIAFDLATAKSKKSYGF